MKEKMINGELYIAADEELRKDLLRSKDLCLKYNLTNSESLNERDKILKQLLGSIGNNYLIEPPFYCDYGFNITIGDNFYANHNCTILDGCEVKIGNNVVIGAGSVVTKDIPDNVVAAGNPCKIIREITEEDDKYFESLI